MAMRRSPPIRFITIKRYEVDRLPRDLARFSLSFSDEDSRMLPLTRRRLPLMSIDFTITLGADSYVR